MTSIKFLLLFTLALPSCNNSITKYQIFNGNWHLIKINAISCNACPIFKFQEQKKGVITDASDETLHFNFELNGNQIVFSYAEDVIYFGDETVFKFRHYQEGDLYFLELKSLNGEQHLVLGRGVK